MANLVDLLSYDNEVLRAYFFWSAVLVIKVLAMAILTGQQRKKNNVMANPEDLQFLKDPPKDVKATFGDPDVERVRRAHRNDLENCLPFMIVGLFYVLSDPSTFIAVNAFRFGVFARIVHTYAYAINPMQPARGISWLVNYLITIFMAVNVMMKFC